MDNMDKQLLSINIDQELVKLHEKLYMLEDIIKMFNLEKDITLLEIDVLQTKKIILSLEKQFTQNEYGDSTIMNKSVNSEKCRDLKINEAKDTLLKLNSTLKSEEKIHKPFTNHMINENKCEQKKYEEETEEISVRNKCFLANYENNTQLILTLENEFQQSIEEFEKECEQLHLTFNNN